MYNRIIISNFPQNLIVISQFFSFFFVIFSVFVILVIFGLFFYPQTPGGPKFLAMELNLSQAPLRCQPASKNCFMITFFCVNSAKTLIWSFSLFWGILVGLQGGKLSHGGYLEGCTWSQSSVYQPTRVFSYCHPQNSNFCNITNAIVTQL